MISYFSINLGLNFFQKKKCLNGLFVALEAFSRVFMALIQSQSYKNSLTCQGSGKLNELIRLHWSSCHFVHLKVYKLILGG